MSSVASKSARTVAPTIASDEEVRIVTLIGDAAGSYQVRKASFGLSLLSHALAIAVVFGVSQFLASGPRVAAPHTIGIVTEISPYILPASLQRAGGGGGGGDRDKLQASKGSLPKLSNQQISPPVIVVRNQSPKLAIEPTIVAPPEISLPTTGPLGDPFSNSAIPSNGTGSGGGIGSGSGGGIGSGHGLGVGPGWGGGIGGGAYRVGGGVSAPRPIHTPEPEFSEEARKAKYQGTVVLWAVVGSNGLPQQIRVQRSLGMGLDEKAIEAVKTWSFEPARKDGVAVAVMINIEVSFRLY